MAAYNAMNGIPMTVHPILRDIAINEWGQDGIICTDAGGMRLMVSAHKYYPDDEHAAAGTIKAGIGQFLERNFADPVRGALKQNLVTEADIDRVLRGNFRVMIRLGVLDPAAMVPYRKIGTGPEPWHSEKHRKIAREATARFGLQHVDIIHRIGRLLIGENILIIVVSAGHRPEAYAGSRYIIEEIKKSVPVWKKELTKDGGRWVPGEHGHGKGKN